MTPQERAAALLELIDPFVPQYAWRDAEQKRTVKLELIANAIQATRRAALLEIRQFCVDYEDCCVLGLVAHANKAVTDASISTMQFIKRHIDDRLAQEG